ncbi:putative RNA-binding Zn ribbon-like protein [Catenulispora sp. GP43]|uniref:CGNR zinc finger domain-containing protein n=1 Tax=Catenulispora sp. GP43 TaxID=3156263 RepID=UPI003517C220
MPRDRIVRGLVDFTHRADLDRLHQCEDVKCGWVYLDTSPRRNRRWCDTKDCGDRNRARAFYARQKAKSSA